MPKSYADSKTSVLNDSGPSKPSENGAFLYAKTTDIPGVLTLIDVLENMTISYAHPAHVSRVLTVVECQRTGRFCMWILQISQQRFYFLTRYAPALVTLDFHLR